MWLWGDAEERASAIETVVGAWEAGDAAGLRAAITRVDRAVVEGLDALGLPRGPVAEIQIAAFGRNWLGRKHPDCRLMLDGHVMRQAVRALGRPDEVFRTWIHESLHGRQPYVVDPGSEQRRVPGYEEGMVEGLARIVTREKAAIRIVESSYDYYVRAYEALGAVVGVDAEQFWRELWRYPTGEVRSAMFDVADRVWQRAAGHRLTAAQRRRLQGVADQMFGPSRASVRAPDAGDLRAAWRVVFR